MNFQTSIWKKNWFWNCFTHYSKCLFLSRNTNITNLSYKLQEYLVTVQNLHVDPSQCLKITQMSHLIWILEFSTNYCPIPSDLSGNTVWPQASRIQLSSIQKCKRSSLRSQCWMRLFLWFSNTVVKIILPQNSAIKIGPHLNFLSNFLSR